MSDANKLLRELRDAADRLVALVDYVLGWGKELDEVIIDDIRDLAGEIEAIAEELEESVYAEEEPKELTEEDIEKLKDLFSEMVAFLQKTIQSLLLARYTVTLLSKMSNSLNSPSAEGEESDKSHHEHSEHGDHHEGGRGRET